MKASELMIGDWVKFTSKYGYGTGQVVGIEPMEGTADPTTFTIWKKDKEGNTKFFVGVSKNGVEPIPFTPEILKKNGFGYVESDSELSHYYLGEPQYCADMNFHIGTDRKGRFWLNYHNNSIYGLRYVHELQHALRLFGTGREIEL